MWTVSWRLIAGPLSSAICAIIPIPRGGMYHGVEGVDRAAGVAGIEDVIITAKEGQALIPPPEGATVATAGASTARASATIGGYMLSA